MKRTRYLYLAVAGLLASAAGAGAVEEPPTKPQPPPITMLGLLSERLAGERVIAVGRVRLTDPDDPRDPRPPS